MDIRRLVIASAVVLVTVLTTALASAPPAQAAQGADERCFDGSLVHIRRSLTLTNPDLPVVVPEGLETDNLRWNSGDWPVVVTTPAANTRANLDVFQRVCADTVLTFRTPTGAVRNVPLPRFSPFATFGHYENLKLGSADTGLWQLTGIRSGSQNRQVVPPKPFWIYRKTVVLLDHLPVATAGTYANVTGRVVSYTRDGTPAPYLGARVLLTSANLDGGGYQHDLGTARTDSRGRFSLRMRVTRSQLIRAVVGSFAPYAADSDVAPLYAGTGIQLLSLQEIPVSGGVTVVTGRTRPGNRRVLLDLGMGGEEDAWGQTVSSATSRADGWFSLRYRATGYPWRMLRVRIAGTELQDLRETTAAHRTTLTGVTGGTHTTVIRPGTKMSSFGRLKVTYNNGVTGNFPNQTITVQTKPRGIPTAVFTTVATARTTTTGYFYTNWTARQDVDVRIAYFTPYPTFQWAVRSQGFLDVR